MVNKTSFTAKLSSAKSKMVASSISTLIPASEYSRGDNEAIRQERQKQLGIDCHDEIIWRNWEVGREYEKRLQIKNTHDKLQVIRYKLPKLKAIYFVDYPEPVSWGSGMSYYLVVKFRPIEMIPYHDVMEVEIEGRGSFFVKLSAFIPFSELTTPDHHDSGMCPVNTITSNSFQIKNTGTVPLHFEWDIESPFALDPKVASLKVGEHLDMKVTFFPKEASAMVAQAVCKAIPQPETSRINSDPVEDRPVTGFNRGKESILATVRFSGIGKYAFIQMKNDARSDLESLTISKSSATHKNPFRQNTITSINTNSIVTYGGDFTMDTSASIVAPIGRSDPFVIDFGDALVLTSHVRYITLVNPSFVDADFTLRRMDKDIVENPFYITPLKGTISKHGGEQRFTVCFNPKSSGARYTSDYIVDSQCCCSWMKLRFTGVGTGPCVTLSTTYLDFGGVNLESICGEDVTVKHGTDTSTDRADKIHAEVGNIVDNGTNPTPIIQLDRFISLNSTSELPQRFQFIGMETGGAFSVTPSFGFLKPNGSVNIKVSFSPMSTMNYLRRIFLLTSMAETAQILDVFGTGYTAKCHPEFFNINDVRFYFAKIGYGLGGISPEKTEKLMIDILKEEELEKNSILSKSNDFRVRNNGEDGDCDVQDTAAREALKAAMKISSGKRCRTASLAAVSESIGEEAPGTITHPFVMDSSLIIVRHEARSENRTVTIRNTTNTKVTAVWAFPNKRRNIRKEITNSDPDIEGFDQTGPQSWYVMPESADIPPFGSVTFNVQLSNSVTPVSFCVSLECYVYYKTMRSFRLVNEHSFIPPQCLTLQCLHISQYRENGPIPQVSIPNSVSFPPCRIERSVYQVVELQNKGDTAVAYAIKTEANTDQDLRNYINDANSAQNSDDGKIPTTNNFFSVVNDNNNNNNNPLVMQDAGDDSVLLMDDLNAALERKELLKDVFHCYPTAGIIPANGSAFVLARFSPPTVSCFMGVAHVSYNGSPKANASIFLKGEGFLPKISLESNGKLFFRPTTVRGTTTRHYTVQNLSRIPVSFEVHIPDEFSDVVQLSHSCGTLQGREKISILVSFTPNEVKKYMFQIPFHVFVPDDMGVVRSGDESEKQICTVEGEGHAALLAIEPMSERIDDVILGNTTKKVITISNTGLSDVPFQLRYLLDIEGREKCCSSGEGFVDVEFGPSSKGIVRARAHHSVNVRITLQRRGNYRIIVYALAHGDHSLLQGMSAPTRHEVEERLPHCTFYTEGEHGILQISDVRCVYQQKSQLWRQMNIPSINAHLSESICDADHAIHLLMFEDAVKELDSISCNLGVDIYHAAPITILAALENMSPVPISYDFRFPLDNDIPKEPWHPDQRSLDDPVVVAVDHELFDIQPRSETIPSGGYQIITLQYFHKDLGEHFLPVILRVDGGKQVLLNLHGTTNVIETKYLAFRQPLYHEISPVAIGDLDPPIQYTEIQNLSRQSVQYTIDERSFDAIKSANYDFPVLQCLNSKGIIPAMSTLVLSWLFRPIEAKTYKIPLSVMVEDGETYDITLVGNGYHPKMITDTEVREIYANKTFYKMPIIPCLEDPSLPLQLSIDVMNFGSVPFYSLHRRHVSLTNKHATDTFFYEWHSVLQHGDQIFDIEPAAGEIGPGESVHFRVTMYSGSISQVIDTPVHCYVLNRSLQKRRRLIIDRVNHNAMLEMRQEKDLLNNNDVATSDSTNLTRYLHNTKEQTYRKCLSQNCIKSTNGQRQSITTIPPKYQSIGTLRSAIQSIEDTVVSHNIDENADELAHVEVTATIIELVLQTRIMPSESYAEIYGVDSLKGVFFPTLLGVTQGSTLMERSPYLADVSDNNNNNIMEDMATGCITEMLKRLMHNNNCVKDALLDPRDEYAMYFCELVSSFHEDRRSTVSHVDNVGNVGVVEESGVITEGGSTNDIIPIYDSYDESVNDRPQKLNTINVDQTIIPIPSATFEKKDIMGPLVNRITIDEDPPAGDMQCVAEEVIGETLFSLIANALSVDGVITEAFRSTH